MLVQESIANLRFSGLGMDEVSRDLKTVFNALNTSGSGLTSGDIVFVSELSDLPEPSNSVITLLANVTYFFLKAIDLQGNRLVGGANTVILGASSENSRITSTGLGVGVALFTTQYTTPIRHISFDDVDTLFDIDGDGNTTAMDWTGVNFVNIPNIGVLSNISNFIFSKGAALNSQNMIFDGTHGTISFDNSLLQGNGSVGDIVKVADTATITRRLRIVYSSVVAFGATTGINVSDTATIPVEGFILDTINFSGGSTYVSGVQYDDNKARFVECRGVKNSSELTGYTMAGNATATVISSTGVPVKVAGVTTPNVISQKFDNSVSNRALFEGALTRDFKVSVIVSVSAGNNNQVGIYIAKNGTPLDDSEIYITTNSSGRLENGSCQVLTELSTGDYIEVFVENNTSTTNITVSDLSVIIQPLS